MADTISSDSVAQDQLRAFIERIERLEEEKKAIADDIRDIYAEAKGNGFDTKVLRQVIKIRKQDRAERLEQEALLDLYLAALGMQASIEEILFGPGRQADGTTNLVGALRRAMATTGYSDVKEFQRVEVVVSPYLGQ